jgi:hypothetical protein
MTTMGVAQRLLCTTLAVLFVGLLIEEHAAAQETTAKVGISETDRWAATAAASNVRFHLFLANTPAAKGFPRDWPAIPARPFAVLDADDVNSNASSVIPFTVASPPAPAFYPEDVTKLSVTGKTILTTKHHLIYVNCAPTCWGDASTFLTDLGKSTFMKLLDQYVGSTTTGRYTVGSSASVSVTIFAGTTGVPTLGENDILAIVHAVAKLAGFGTGYGNLYHVLIPPGVDTCMDEGGCYSPDHPPSFVFCAYHNAVHFTDIGNTYYTVEPFQDVMGCQVPASPTPPNGQLADSTYSVLSHEVYESITDPDITTGFRALNSAPVLFLEIGDLCAGPHAIFSLNGHSYEVQLEYSNFYHACASSN